MDPLPASSIPPADPHREHGPVLHRFSTRWARDAEGGFERGFGTRVTLTPEALIVGRFFIFQSRYERNDLSLLDREQQVTDGTCRMSFHVRRRPYALMLDVPADSVEPLLDWLDAYRLEH